MLSQLAFTDLPTYLARNDLGLSVLFVVSYNSMSGKQASCWHFALVSPTTSKTKQCWNLMLNQSPASVQKSLFVSFKNKSLFQLAIKKQLDLDCFTFKRHSLVLAEICLFLLYLLWVQGNRELILKAKNILDYYSPEFLLLLITITETNLQGESDMLVFIETSKAW